jgi:hypothetical protein
MDKGIEVNVGVGFVEARRSGSHCPLESSSERSGFLCRPPRGRGVKLTTLSIFVLFFFV